MTIDTSPIKLAELLSLCISTLALATSFITVVYFYRQIKAYFQQQHLEFHIKLCEINRDLFKTAFDHPELFTVLNGSEIENKEKQTRFIQMCMNQTLLMWMGKENGIISDEAWYPLRKDIATFLNHAPVTDHWRKVAAYYIPSFATFMNGLLRPTLSSASESVDNR